MYVEERGTIDRWEAPNGVSWLGAPEDSVNGPAPLLTQKPLRLHHHPWPLFVDTATIRLHCGTIMIPPLIIILRTLQTEWAFSLDITGPA